MKPIFALLALSLFAQFASAQNTLNGTYERVSLTNTRTGESPEAANRKGILILADGYYSMMTMNPDRRVVSRDTNIDEWPATDQIKFYKEWLDVNAHSGRLEIDGNELVWYRDISEDPREVGTVSRLQFEQRDKLLVISFVLPNNDRYEWVWRPVER